MKRSSTDGDVYILAIESSCDETAAAVVKNGREVIANVISSQIDLHTLYGGIVPEIASRKHIEKINQVIEEALSQAGVTLEEITAIGVTYGPARGGRLLLAVPRARPIAIAAANPWGEVPIFEGHCPPTLSGRPGLGPPFWALIVSAGDPMLETGRVTGELE